MTTEERFEKLERELACAKRRNRVQLITMICVVISFLGGLYVAGTAIGQGSVQEEVRAKNFILLDENGKVRGMLDAMENIPTLRLWDENDTLRISLGVSEDEAYLDIYDENGEIGTELNVSEGLPGLGMWDEDGQLRTLLNVTESGANFDLNYENGDTGVELYVDEDAPSLGMYDSDGELRTMLDVLEDVPTLRLWDENGTI
jgi:hypothetical protein